MKNGRSNARVSARDRILAIVSALEGYAELEVILSRVNSVKPETIFRTLKRMVKAGEIVQLATRYEVFPVFFMPEHRVDIPFLEEK